MANHSVDLELIENWKEILQMLDHLILESSNLRKNEDL